MVKRIKWFFLRPVWGLADYVALALLPLVLIWVFSPSIWPVQQFIDLRRVEVRDAFAGDPIYLTVDRSVLQSAPSHRAEYRVQVREYPNGIPACFDRASLSYEADATLDPSRLVRLSWWTFGDRRDCVEWEPRAEPGEYVLITTHCWKRYFWTRWACRSVRSNPFQLFAREE